MLIRGIHAHLLGPSEISARLPVLWWNHAMKPNAKIFATSTQQVYVCGLGTLSTSRWEKAAALWSITFGSSILGVLVTPAMRSGCEFTRPTLLPQPWSPKRRMPSHRSICLIARKPWKWKRLPLYACFECFFPWSIESHDTVPHPRSRHSLEANE